MLPCLLKDGLVSGRNANSPRLGVESVIERRADRENSPARLGPGLEDHHFPTSLLDEIRRPEPRQACPDDDDAFTTSEGVTRQ
jgi:hypothetical protein